MTPNQGNNPNRQRGQRPSGSEHQQSPPGQPPQQPVQQQGGGFQQQPPQQRQGGQSPGMSGSQGAPPRGQPPTGQSPPGQPGNVSQGRPPGASMQSQQLPPQAQQPPARPQQAQFQAQTGGMQSQQRRGPQQGGGVQLRPIRVEDIVEEDVVTAERDTPIATVVEKMSDEDVGSVVVVENDQPVGIITDRSIAMALENTPDVANKQASELISEDLVTATTSMTVFDVLRRLSDEEIRRLPIVDDDGSLQGIISLDDILVLLGSELNRVGETIKAQSPRL